MADTRRVVQAKQTQAMSASPPTRAAQRVLAAWRGIDLTEQERARADRARSSGNLMPTLLKRLGLDQRRREAEVAKVWHNLIDPVVTAHAQPAGIHKGTLFVNVDSNVWLSEIVRYRRHEILQRLQHAFGPDFIARISFRVG